MKRLQPLVFSAALLLLAACGENTQPEAAAPSFSFSIDPGSETVSLQGSGAAALGTLQTDGSDEPRILFPDEELALTAYDAVFLPGNILEITAEFTNVTECTFEQPFTFTQAESTDNIVSSQEAEVTDADLGGDGELSPEETTTALTFTVEHMGQPFTYEVFAEAVVSCDDGDPTDPTAPVDPTDPTDATDPSDPTDATDPTDPTDATDPTAPVDPDLANLVVTKTAEAELIDVDDTGTAIANFTVAVENIGGTDAADVVLTDLLTVDLAGLLDVTATVTAALPLPEGCSLVIDEDLSNSIECDLGTIAAGTTATRTFSFAIAVLGNVAEETSVTVTNSATASSPTEDAAPGDNTTEVEVTVVLPEVVDPTDPTDPTDATDPTDPTDPTDATDPTAPVDPTPADLAVTKTAGDDITIDPSGDGTGTLDYQVVVTNNGESAAENFILVDTFTIVTTDLPDEATLDNITVEVLNGGVIEADCTADPFVAGENAVVVTCVLGELAAGATETLDFAFNFDLGGSLLGVTAIAATNVAVASTTSLEPVTTNNTADAASTIIVGLPPL